MGSFFFFFFGCLWMSDAVWRAHLIRPAVGLRDHSGGGQWRTNWAGRPGLNQLHSQPPCVCIHTGIKTYTRSQMSANTVAGMPAWLPHQGQRHSAAAWWQGTLIKWEPPWRSIQIKKKKGSVCTSPVCWATGVWGVFVCGCGWGGYLKPSHPLNPPSSASIEGQQKRESRLRAEIQGDDVVFPASSSTYSAYLFTDSS